MKFKIFLIIVAVILFIIFLIQNTAQVTVTFITLDMTMPRAILLFLTLIIGILIGVFLPFEFKKNRTGKPGN